MYSKSAMDKAKYTAGGQTKHHEFEDEEVVKEYETEISELLEGDEYKEADEESKK